MERFLLVIILILSVCWTRFSTPTLSQLPHYIAEYTDERTEVLPALSGFELSWPLELAQLSSITIEMLLQIVNVTLGFSLLEIKTCLLTIDIPPP